MERINSITDLVQASEKYRNALSRQTLRISVCADTGCIANGSLNVYKKLVEVAEKDGGLVNIQLLSNDENVKGKAIVKTGCLGFCTRGPMVRVDTLNLVYVHVKEEDAEEIYCSSLKGEVVERLLEKDPETNKPYLHIEESPFYRKQKINILEHSGHIDPASIEEYIADNGFRALAKVLSGLSPEDVNQIVSESGLRGRGGGGFPTGTKWKFARTQNSEKKYMICNGDEGDPGAFMNRSVLEGDCFRVIEGMMIAGYTIGADEGIFYVRAEYPLAVKRLKASIKRATRLSPRSCRKATRRDRINGFYRGEKRYFKSPTSIPCSFWLVQEANNHKQCGNTGKYSKDHS